MHGVLSTPLTGYIRDVRYPSKLRRQLEDVRASREAQGVSRDDEDARVSALFVERVFSFERFGGRHEAPRVGRGGLGAIRCRTGGCARFAADGDRRPARSLQNRWSHDLRKTPDKDI